MTAGLDLNAIDEPINMTGAELLQALESDREFAIALAERHGLIGPPRPEPDSITSRWLRGVIEADRRKPCACCGQVHDDPKRIEAGQ